METFVLVHGAWHSGNVWDVVARGLEARRHQVIAPTLAIDDPAAGSPEFLDVIASAAVGIDRAVLVGHTSGAMLLPLLVDRIPVERLVYVNPLVPALGESIMGESGDFDISGSGESGRRYDRQARSYWVLRDEFEKRLAAGVPADEIDRVYAQLRPQARRLLNEPFPLTSMPAVDAQAVIYKDDRDLSVDWMLAASVDRLQAEPVLLDGPQLGFLADPGGFVEVLTSRRSGPRP